jgi:hypothetical protein
MESRISRLRLIWLLPHPYPFSCQQVLSLSQSPVCRRPSVELTDVVDMGEEGAGEDDG